MHPLHLSRAHNLGASRQVWPRHRRCASKDQGARLHSGGRRDPPWACLGTYMRLQPSSHIVLCSCLMLATNIKQIPSLCVSHAHITTPKLCLMKCVRHIVRCAFQVLTSSTSFSLQGKCHTSRFQLPRHETSISLCLNQD
ncbi:hypothetical protein BS78_09G143400 [Paspalum vaginatum]|nr:hypothetical protein BS78_09G143400 [Paspalum vaginatum]